MESVEAQIAYTLHTTLRDVEEKFQAVWQSGHGKDVKFKRYSLGWYILIDGSMESIRLSEIKPDLVPGDRVKITIQKVP